MLIAQKITTFALMSCGFPHSHIIQDRHVTPKLLEGGPNLAAGYVDNFVVLGTDLAAVRDERDRISAYLRRLGFLVHEENEASGDAEVLGLQFCSKTKTISVKKSRVWRLRAALLELLRRGACSGHLLEVLVGHITWVALLHRPGLSILDSC